MHVLGAVGNYTFSDSFQSVLSQYGLAVRHDGADGYAVHGVEGGVDLDQICPPSIARQGHVFDLKGLQAFGAFLHQPIRSTLAGIVDGEQAAVSGFRAKAKRRAACDDIVHGRRTAVHRMLRFAVSGSVEIPHVVEDNLEKDTAECHARTEQAMRDADMWRSEVEFGQDEAKISAIPGTGFDAARGFILEVDAGERGYEGAGQAALDAAFWSIVNDATDGRYGTARDEVCLSAAEMERVVALAGEREIGALIDRVEFEEAVQEKRASVRERVRSIAGSPLIEGHGDAAREMRGLMEATSALSPVLGAGFMRDSWAKYNFVARHDAPLEGLQKEMAVFLAAAEAQIEAGETSPAHMEALANEFYSLIAFSGHVCETLDKGLGAQMSAGAERDEAREVRGDVRSLKAVFDHASVVGVRLDSDYLTDEQRDALVTLRKHAKRHDSAGQRIKGAAWAPMSAAGITIKDFAGDVVNFIRDDPRIAVGFVGLAGALIAMKGGDGNAAVETMNVGLAFGDDGEFLDVAVNGDHVPKDVFGNENFHWDLKFSPLSGYEMYKHFANSNFIVGPAQQFMEFTRSSIHGAYGMMGIEQNYDSAFDAAAGAVIEPLADKLFAVNMFQNVSHAAFWMWAAARGYQHGAQGFGKLMELSAPIVDLGYQAGVSGAHMFKDKAALSAQIMEVGTRPFKIDYVHEAPSDSIVGAMADAAQVRADVVRDLPDYAGTLRVDAMGGPLKIDGLKREFNVSAQNLGSAVEALAKFDHFMQQVGAHVAAHEGWHVRSVVSKIGEVREALLAYQASGDDVRLGAAMDEHLEYILASEMRYRDGRSDVYEALFEAAPDVMAAKRLMRSAHTVMGREKRANALAGIKDDLSGQVEEPLTVMGRGGAHAKRAGVHLWGGMVSAAKTARRVTDRAVNTRNVVISGGFATACVAMDMAGAGGEFARAVSGLTGGAVAGTATTATFLNFNFWEDIVGVHLGTGVSLTFAGAAVGYANKKFVAPTMRYAAETKVGSAFTQLWRAP